VQECVAPLVEFPDARVPDVFCRAEIASAASDQVTSGGSWSACFLDANLRVAPSRRGPSKNIYNKRTTDDKLTTKSHRHVVTESIIDENETISNLIQFLLSFCSEILDKKKMGRGPDDFEKKLRWRALNSAREKRVPGP
jgi:hypothetical protein